MRLRQHLFLSILLLVGAIVGHAQPLFKLSGSVFDKALRTPLIGATVTVEPTLKGTAADLNGAYELMLPAGQYAVKASYLGYTAQTQTVTLSQDMNLSFYLTDSSVQISDIQVKAQADDDNVKGREVGVVQISGKELERLPGFMGKPDIIRLMKLNPGVSSGGEGNSGLYVRGGDAGQNLFLFDEMPLYNPSHLMGFFSVFNADAVGGLSLYKGALPAQYGGRTAAVIDVAMADPDMQAFKLNGSVGLLATEATLQIPIVKNKLALLVSGRRTYLEPIQAIVNPFIDNAKSFFKNTTYYFFDGQFKLVYSPNPKNHIKLIGYSGSDYYQLGDADFEVKNNMEWGNSAMALTWHHLWNENLSISNTAGFTAYHMNIKASFDQYALNLNSQIADKFVKSDVNWITHQQLKLKGGVQFTRHNLMPHGVDAQIQDLNYESINRYYSNEFAGYLSGQYQFSETFSLSAGARYTAFTQLGPYTTYSRDEFDQVSDSVLYGENEPVITYHRVSPSASFVKTLDANSAIKGSSGISHQFLHLASVGTVSMPTDLWLSTTQYIEPQAAWISTLGYFRNFQQNRFETSVEVYYKHLTNQIEFLNGILDNFDNTKIEENIVFGTGNSAGIEFYVRKQLGTLTGSVSYTLSKTNRKFTMLNEGDPYPAKYDRTHEISAMANYEISPRWSASAVFVYSTGNAMTLPNGRYIVQGNVANDYTEVNGYRMPPYHRLDLSATYRLVHKGRFKSNLVLAVYNVYNRQNPYYMYFKVQGNLDQYYLEVTPTVVTLFPILPSITWNFSF